jgi:hypothetical protein
LFYARYDYYANLYLYIRPTFSRIALLANPDRTFNFVEQAFFQIWWEQASDLSRQQMRNMVASGQMQFTNGGWW